MRAVIVPNFDDNGGVLGGLLKKQNALEAGIFLGIGMLIFFACLSNIASVALCACILVITMIGTVFFAIGIGDESVARFLVTVIKYRLTARVATLMMPSDENHY